VQPLAFKMLFRKKGTASAIIAIALLIALVASVNSLVNNINSQMPMLSALSNVGQTYLLTSRSSTALSDSQVDPSLINQIQNNPNVIYATSQQIVQAVLGTNLGSYTVDILGVNNVTTYLIHDSGGINGSVSLNRGEVDVGVVLANLARVSLHEQVNVTVNGQTSQLTVVGITETTHQSDTQLIMPQSALQELTQNRHAGSYIEFSLKTAGENQTLTSLSQTLPSDVKITKVQQVQTFIQDINGQTVNFINVWSIAVYVVITAASYIIATRLIDESRYELCMFRTLGAKKKATITLIILYTLTIAFLGSLIGIAVGIVGTQIAATGIRWLGGSFTLAPFLQPFQVVEILLLALAACLVGCMYPAARTAQSAASENPL